jgi:uncharacterized protein YdaU (DUF1376 family)
MSAPWMPLYVGDYIADTRHLRTVEHGAYLLLIMHYWRKGSLPDNDELLARITGIKLAEWCTMRPIIEAFFQPGWKHKRIEFELTESARISEAGRRGGKASGIARKKGNVAKSIAKSNDRSTTVERPLNDQRTIDEALHSPSPSKKDKEAYASLRARKRASRLSAEWWPSTEGINFAIGKGLNQQCISVEAEKFRNYWIAKAGTGATKLDWDATWRNWILNACEHSGGPGNGRRQSLSDRAFQLADEFEAAERARSIERPPDRK